MTPASTNLLGAASVIPMLSYLLMRQAATLDALVEAGTAGAVLALVALSAGLGVIFFFAWIAAGEKQRPFAWKLRWVLALTLAGVAAAPLFWYLHVRPAPEASGG